MVTHRKIRNYLVSIPNLMIWFGIKVGAAFNMAIEQPEGFTKGYALRKKDHTENTICFFNRLSCRLTEVMITFKHIPNSGDKNGR